MKDLDKKIREAIRAEDPDLVAGFGEEPSIFELLFDTMRGRHRWLNLLGAIFTLAFLALAIVCAVKFFAADEVRDLLMWAAGFVVCFSSVGMMKIWYWLEMQRNATTREIKRLELQIARLAGKLKD
jgi:uncharacterized membrane protein YciS (DUF1049 family)